MSKKKSAKKPLEETCPKCRSTKFAVGSDMYKTRYCTLTPEQGYDGIGAKGCGAMWKAMSEDQLKLQHIVERNRKNVELAAECKALIAAFEQVSNGESPTLTIPKMGELHSVLKERLTIIENSKFS